MIYPWMKTYGRHEIYMLKAAETFMSRYMPKTNDRNLKNYSSYYKNTCFIVKNEIYTHRTVLSMDDDNKK